MKSPWLLVAGAAAIALLLLPRRTSGAQASPTGDASTPVDDGIDYQGATWIGAKAFGRSSSSREIDYVVIHINDGGDSARATAQYFADGAEGREVSSHYVVGRLGEVFQCVREADVAYHAHAANATSIGIENIARTAGELGANDTGLPVTDANYHATAVLCADICARYGLPRDRSTIVGHNEIDSQTTHADCPTGQWDWDTFMAVLEELP